MSAGVVLEADGIVVEYGRRPPLRAVDGVGFRVAAGEVVALVGESGCGKSSLARAVVGIEKRRGGDVRLNGVDVPALGLRRRSPAMTGVQMVFQDPNSSLNPRRRIGEQIGDGVRAALARGAEGSDPADWLRRVGLDPAMASRFPHEFSGGQKQRIAIARALAARPRMLVADEPISALDASTQTSVAALMRSLSVEAGAGMLFISHDLSVVRRIADRVLVMYRGRVVESGDTETVWQSPLHPYTRALLAAIPLPDGLGRLPLAPLDADRAAWLEELPDALERTGA
ncbi:ABC transporter ATP-binding protein [Rathayibacter sp. AY1G1]|uniref:ATP-binding cassette domain-containing protein n=1 Tax=unclassified Rathayibacter TaxID=2609250 RepID=UPI000CE83C72|nr:MULTISPECIES: ATP-binding cassette domain-containing protein [unclassified Rathayibacter]PPF13120.1 ABC transporter ATP-binding protein [Rathayibacter sp. AY1A5]PPF40992.1 ABC transporter ATP-binding protein [Rathayibacter sp. AY1A3]PPG01695.1 ABC transporter ATP-binding protein [Rathayibacter sp. AY2B1]PPG15357.1 ABC transporter ATP-binding protein [Rathayibacter sp. AY1C6]PPG54234.1 ABC transporter ATP-binding protein [Rathayibacter sp. AY1E9]